MAPLKHLPGGLAAVVHRPFPRLQKRGPIEAEIVRPSCSARWRSFHAYKSVAPLKRASDGAPEGEGGVFPRLQKRGPIEAGLVCVGH